MCQRQSQPARERGKGGTYVGEKTKRDHPGDKQDEISGKGEERVEEGSNEQDGEQRADGRHNERVDESAIVTSAGVGNQLDEVGDQA